jgi:hypothetical protein
MNADFADETRGIRVLFALKNGPPIINGKEPHHEGHKGHQGVKMP